MKFSSEQEFIDFLFNKLLVNTDFEMIDLHDDDSAGIDAIEFEKLHESDDWLFVLNRLLVSYPNESR